MKEYDVIVLGAGPGGYEYAAACAARGQRTAIIEKSHPGGTCLNRGCIPTKALLHSAQLIDALRGATACGIEVTDCKISFKDAARHKDTVVATLREAVAQVLADVDVIQGEGSFSQPHVIDVEGESYTAPHIVIATGSRPALPPIDGIANAMTSDTLLELDELPASMAIIGGGVIGMEFAAILNSFGVKVTVLEYCDEILPTFDREIAKKLRQILSRRGIDIVTGATVTAVTPGSVTYTRRNKEITLDTRATLVATGRTPAIPAGAVEAGIEVTRRGITVDDNMMTSVPGVYAIGDVNGRCMLAHAATAQGHLLLGGKVNLANIPSAVFTTPEFAATGATEQQLQQQEIPYVTGKATFRFNGKALTMSENDGLVKILADPATHRILGAHILGPHASDLIQGLVYAIDCNLTADDLQRSIHGHPTLSEVVQRALSALPPCAPSEMPQNAPSDMSQNSTTDIPQNTTTALPPSN